MIVWLNNRLPSHSRNLIWVEASTKVRVSMEWRWMFDSTDCHVMPETSSRFRHQRKCEWGDESELLLRASVVDSNKHGNAKSPNDTRRASFKPYVSCSLFLCVFFYILTNVLLYIQVIHVIHARIGTTMRMSPLVSFFFFFFYLLCVCFFLNTNIFYYSYRL